MADNTTPLQRDLYEIAHSLEEAGHPHLATIVDQANYEVHTRVATVSKKKPARPARKASKQQLSVKEDLRKIRWAKDELRDIARDLRKSGKVKDIREARELVKLAADLEEQELLIEGPVMDSDSMVEVTDHVHGDDCCLHNHAQQVDVETEDMSFDGDDDSLGMMDEGTPHDHDGDIMVEDEMSEGTDEATDEEMFDTVEACARELRVCARLLKRQGNLRMAARIQKFAKQIEADSDGTEPCELPEPNGESSVIDSTDFDFGSIDLDDVAGDVETESDELMDFDVENEESSDLADAEDDTMEDLEDDAGESALMDDDLDLGEEAPVEDEAEEQSEEYIEEDQFDDNEPESTEETEDEIEEEDQSAYTEAASVLARTARQLAQLGHKDAAQKIRQTASRLRKS